MSSMPPPPPSLTSNSRMPSSSSNVPLLSSSPTGFPPNQVIFNNNFSGNSSLHPTGIYQVSSPGTPVTLSTSASKIQVGGQLPMAPATINIPQPTQPVPTKLHANSLNFQQANSNAPVQQVMQIIQTQSSSGAIRHQPIIMKPIQPKPQQILPKPAGISNQVTYSSGKPVTLSTQRPTSTMNISAASHQNNPLVIGQGQTILPNSGVMGHQALFLNQILGVGQNQFIIPSGTSLPSNVQLVMRPQPTSTGGVPASQSPQAAVNNLMAAFAQSQANQQTFINQNKSLPGQGQTMMMQAGQTLRAGTPPQMSNASMRPNMISGTHMVSQGQPPLVLQQIQGPITVIQALQGANVGVGSTGITLANPTSAAGIGQLGGILQGAVANSQPQSFVLNNQPVITTSMASLISPLGETINVSQLHNQQQQQQAQQHQQQQQQTMVQSQQTQPRAQSVNLEELLKQAGIMPDDGPSSPQPTNDVSQVQMEAQQQPIVTFAHLPTMSSDGCISMMNGSQTVVMGQEQFQSNQSALLAHLQQPMVSQQLQSGAPVQTQVKFSLTQDGSVIIQRPVLTQGPSLNIGHSNQHPHHVTFSIANLSMSTGNTTSTTTNTTSNMHPLQSVVFQTIDGASHLQTQNAATVQQQQQQLAAAGAASAAASIIPLSLQGINLNLVSGLSPASTYVPTSMSGVTYSTTPTPPQQQQQHNQQQHQQQFTLKQSGSRCTTPSNNQVTISVAGPNSVLSQNHPKLVQTLGGDVSSTSAANVTPTSSNSIQFTVSGNKMVQQNPLLLHSINSKEVETTPSVVVVSSTTPTSVQTINSMASTSLSSPCVSSSTSISPAVIPQQTSAAKAPTMLVAGGPMSGLKPGHRIQTIQLSSQGQEALQRIQAQLQAVLARKQRTNQDVRHIQRLQSEQQMILSQGKVISVQTQPLVQQFTRPTVPTSIEQTRCLPPNNSINSQVQMPNPVIVSSAHCTSVKSNQNASNIRATSARNATTFQVSSSSAVLQPTQSTTVINSSQPHIKIGNQIFTFAQQQQTGIVGQTIKAEAQVQQQQQQQMYSNQTKQSMILKIQQQQNISTQSDKILTKVQNINVSPGVNQIQQLNRGLKRPASTPASRSSLIHQRLAADHNSVLCTDHKTPFQSKEDAFRRLLPYHVLAGRVMGDQELQKADNLIENVSEQLMDKMNLLFNKYRHLLLKESMKSHSIAEEVMLERLFMQEEKDIFELEKTNIENGKEFNLPFSPVQWKDNIKTEPGYKPGVENELINAPGINGEVVRIKQEPIDDTVSREKKKNYDEWAEIQKALEMYPVGNDDIGSSTEPVEFEPPSGSASPGVDFEPPFAKIPKSEISAFKENCQVNHIQRNHLDNYETGCYYQSHGHTLRSDSSQWDTGRRISHPHKHSEDENAVLGLEDISGLGMDHDINRINHHQQTHGDESDSNDMTGLFAAAAAASVENNRSGSVDDDSQDDELSAQVQCAINSILNLQRIDDSCEAFTIPMVEDGFANVGNGCILGIQNVGDNSLIVNSELAVENNCSYFDFKREEEEEEEEAVEEEEESEVEQHVISYENNVVGVSHEMVGSYSMEGPSDIDIALDEAVKSILL